LLRQTRVTTIILRNFDGLQNYVFNKESI